MLDRSRQNGPANCPQCGAILFPIVYGLPLTQGALDDDSVIQGAALNPSRSWVVGGAGTNGRSPSLGSRFRRLLSLQSFPTARQTLPAHGAISPTPTFGLSLPFAHRKEALTLGVVSAIALLT